jgi:hypothetical protein
LRLGEEAHESHTGFQSKNYIGDSCYNRGEIVNDELSEWDFIVRECDGVSWYYHVGKGEDQGESVEVVPKV